MTLRGAPVVPAAAGSSRTGVSFIPRRSDAASVRRMRSRFVPLICTTWPGFEVSEVDAAPQPARITAATDTVRADQSWRRNTAGPFLPEARGNRVNRWSERQLVLSAAGDLERWRQAQIQRRHHEQGDENRCR